MTKIDLGREGFITLDQTLSSLHAIIDADMRVAVGHVGSGRLAMSEAGDHVVVSLDGSDVFVLSPTDFRGGWRTYARDWAEPMWLLNLDTGLQLLVGNGTTVQVQAPAPGPRH